MFRRTWGLKAAKSASGSRSSSSCRTPRASSRLSKPASGDRTSSDPISRSRRGLVDGFSEGGLAERGGGQRRADVGEGKRDPAPGTQATADLDQREAADDLAVGRPDHRGERLVVVSLGQRLDPRRVVVGQGVRMGEQERTPALVVPALSSAASVAAGASETAMPHQPPDERADEHRKLDQPGRGRPERRSPPRGAGAGTPGTSLPEGGRERFPSPPWGGPWRAEPSAHPAARRPGEAASPR